MGGYQILLNYRGGLEKFHNISLTEVLENHIPEDFLRARLVFIGAKAPSLNDNYSTPYNSALLILLIQRQFDEIKKWQEVEQIKQWAPNQERVYKVNRCKQSIQPSGWLKNSKYFDVLNVRFEEYFWVGH